MGERIDTLWDIIEIKRADTAVLKDTVMRKAFYSQMQTYVSQAADYAKYFNDKAHRQEFESQYNCKVQEQPDSFIIAGRNAGLDRHAVHGLLSPHAPKITHHTYDDIRNRLELQRLSLFGKHEHLAIQFVVAFDKPATPAETYIFDIGRYPNRNRISAFCSPNGDLNFVVYDDKGTRQQAVVPRGRGTFDYGQPIYIYLEAGSGGEVDGKFLPLLLDC
jgi:hypothetical protein